MAVYKSNPSPFFTHTLSDFCLTCWPFFENFSQNILSFGFSLGPVHCVKKFYIRSGLEVHILFCFAFCNNISKSDDIFHVNKKNHKVKYLLTNYVTKVPLCCKLLKNKTQPQLRIAHQCQIKF